MDPNVSAPAPEHAYFRNARFVLSVTRVEDLPADDGREIAFLGRSNVGKSSVINMLCGRRGLARTSRTPGRTQQFVVFDLGGGRRLMDLPGFGYAAVDKATRARWRATLPRYLETRRSLAGLVLIADARHPLRSEELELVRAAHAAGVPLVVLLNKVDKLGNSAARDALRTAAREIAACGGDAEALRLCSAVSGVGAAELRALLHRWWSDITVADTDGVADRPLPPRRREGPQE